MPRSRFTRIAMHVSLFVLATIVLAVGGGVVFYFWGLHRSLPGWR